MKPFLHLNSIYVRMCLLFKLREKRRKEMKKVITLLLCAIMAIGMMGCSFSIGGGSKSENKNYKEIFPDRASEQGFAYKTGYMAYDFTAGNFGEMKVYVDTSEGHSFKVDSENGGFFINDESGKEVLHAYVLDPSVYKQVTPLLPL